MYTLYTPKTMKTLVKLRNPESSSGLEQEKQKTPNSPKDVPRFLPYHPEPSLQGLNSLFIDGVDPAKQKDRGKVAINTIIVNGEIGYKLESWGRSSSFQIVRDTQQNNRLYIKGDDNELIPIKSMEHAIQVMNLGNFIANKSLGLKDGIGNQTFGNTLNKQENPVVNQGNQIIFKGTINDTILYSGNNPNFVTLDIAEFLSKRINLFLKYHKPFAGTEDTTIGDTGNGEGDPRDILKGLQNI